MDFQAKRKLRKVLRGSFSRCATELEALLSQTTQDVDKIQVCWELLQEKFDELNIVSGEIFDLLLRENASEEELYADRDGCDTYVKRCKELKIRCRKTIDSASVEGDAVTELSTSSAQVQGKRKFKLPVIQFKKFDGNIRDWLSFWAQFRKVDEDPDIDLADKIEYLIQATVIGSRARHLVESFPATGENYEKIVNCLKSRFGREDLQIEVYVRELLKLILNNTSSKNKIDICNLYDNIETQLRALETLGITSDKYAAMLFPLIESCLPEELLRVWQRCSGGLCAVTVVRPAEAACGETTKSGSSSNISLENRLKALMQFLCNEVENEQRIRLASEGFGLRSAKTTDSNNRTDKEKSSRGIPTGADLLNNDEIVECIFCEGTHESANCFKAQHFSLQKKKQLIMSKKGCFRCLKVGHQSKKCRVRMSCVACSNKQHVTLMCPEIKTNKLESSGESHEKQEINATDLNRTHVFLQTLRVQLISGSKSYCVRALIDTGSQRSYILQSTAKKLGLRPKCKQKVLHCLFGGVLSEQMHNCFEIKLAQDGYVCTLEVLDQPKICGDVPPIFPGQWMGELRDLNIEVLDVCEFSSIELLIGADVAGGLYTGRRHVLSCGLVAIETLLGWTLMGKIPIEPSKQGISQSVLNLFVNDTAISNLWELDVLGITEPAKNKTRRELELAAKEFFAETTEVDNEGRYEVRLPWLEGHPPLPTNYAIAQKRLNSVVKKLKSENLLDAYSDIFKEWVQENVIEVVTENTSHDVGHYLPHRPVVKEGSSTTKIRPVFDASAKQKGEPSLNQCLEKGLNLIEKIPNILIRFRENKIGVVSDIRKAFLQISVNESDRECLKFLWLDSAGREMIYRHRRVVFGVNSSPFLLGATIEHHLAGLYRDWEESDPSYSRGTISRLSRSFYVDNCVTSLGDEESLKKFVREATLAMKKGKFDLRGWERTQFSGGNTVEVPVLGLTWNINQDTLSIKDCLGSSVDIEHQVVTKRFMLSMAQRIFDPIGFASPTTLVPKLLIQRTWQSRVAWDAPVEDDIKKEFQLWVKDIKELHRIQVPRWTNASQENDSSSLHIFCDASSKAYACVIFLRVEKNDQVFVNLLAAKSRVAPMNEITIPRLELLSATIGVRLYITVQRGFDKTLPCFFWSDSTTVLSWIRRTEEWATFVWNRVSEIRSATPISAWRHVPGLLNPADLPSRGCSVKHLRKSRWWEGPSWLYKKEEFWPQEEIHCDEEEINREKKKTITTMVNSTANHDSSEWHFTYFSRYTKIIRMTAWIFRFIFNARPMNTKRRGSLTAEELDFAESFVFKIIQREAFVDHDQRLSSFDVFRDTHDVIRLKTRVTNRKDTEYFRLPILLPSRHFVIDKLIFEIHEKSCHVGTQGLLSLLREKYWILGGRRYIRSVISKCVVCKKQTIKHFKVQSPPLPIDRVRDAVAFEVTGIDFAGPLYLKSGNKVWVCLFTCAVYRAVHLELATSLSTPCFMRALRRFVDRRGRPKVIYSDNGTNFVGAENAFEKLNWVQVAEHSSAERIIWRFNPPTAPWWGGFWERLVGILKRLLRKVLGRASLDYEDLLTLVCDCEAIMNSRPLTYVSNDPRELLPLTPAMFLREESEDGLPDCDMVDKLSLCRKIARMQKLREDLRRRFRIEYLGQLRVLASIQPSRSVTVGEVVLVGSDNDKRLDWPIGRVTELLPGKDGEVRLVRVTTAKGQMLRPVQRVYPLEERGVLLEEGLTSEQVDQHNVSGEQPGIASDGSVKSRVPVPKFSRSGRQIKSPHRYLDKE